MAQQIGPVVLAFDEPGWGKIACSISALPYGAHRSLLTYECRVTTTDAESTRRFRRYWWAVRPFVGHVMRATVATIDQRVDAAEQGSLRRFGAPADGADRPQRVSGCCRWRAAPGGCYVDLTEGELLSWESAGESTLRDLIESGDRSALRADPLTGDR